MTDEAQDPWAELPEGLSRDETTDWFYDRFQARISAAIDEYSQVKYPWDEEGKSILFPGNWLLLFDFVRVDGKPDAIACAPNVLSTIAALGLVEWEATRLRAAITRGWEGVQDRE